MMKSFASEASSTAMFFPFLGAFPSQGILSLVWCERTVPHEVLVFVVGVCALFQFPKRKTSSTPIFVFSDRFFDKNFCLNQLYGASIVAQDFSEPFFILTLCLKTFFPAVTKAFFVGPSKGGALWSFPSLEIFFISFP